jgi:hypothetical protein
VKKKLSKIDHLFKKEPVSVSSKAFSSIQNKLESIMVKKKWPKMARKANLFSKAFLNKKIG